ncbi:MAG: thiosulfate oxidation carrier complex protein SoxZ [Hyphomicrobiales bacterium]|nr:thiosulfate oxidation carrier complex protein SoxZ [Hyphomicrobiales bacterium]MBV8827479.1 thiosulfate oxidation carrier complex protein SoxZ [Hyphomicrobiales bacterium]
MTQALVNVPAKAKRGEAIEIKTLISHPMETGYRHDTNGQPIPRDIIHTFVARYNGEEVFRADLHPAIAANPFITFFTVATESGVIELTWTQDHRDPVTQTANITVE